MIQHKLQHENQLHMGRSCTSHMTFLKWLLRATETSTIQSISQRHLQSTPRGKWISSHLFSMRKIQTWLTDTHLRPPSDLAVQSRSLWRGKWVSPGSHTDLWRVFPKPPSIEAVVFKETVLYFGNAWGEKRRKKDLHSDYYIYWLLLNCEIFFFLLLFDCILILSVFTETNGSECASTRLLWSQFITVDSGQLTHSSEKQTGAGFTGECIFWGLYWLH